MKLTRKLLSILLIVAMLSVYFVGSAVAVTAVEAEQANIITGADTPEGIPSYAVGTTNLADLYKKDIEDASTHTLVDVDGRAYVVDSYVKGNSSYSSRIFSVDQIFFGKRGWWADGVYSYEKSATARTIILGEAGTVCTTGLGFQPANYSDTQQTTLVMDISSFNVNRFYSLVGFTGAANNPEYNSSETDTSWTLLDKQVLRYEVYGSSDNVYFNLLSYAEITGSDVGEFNVDITGYKYLKLVAKNLNIDKAGSQNNEAAWGNTCIYADAYNPVSEKTGSFSVYPTLDNRTYLTADADENGTPDRLISNYPTSGTGKPVWDGHYSSDYYVSYQTKYENRQVSSDNATKDDNDGKGCYRLIGDRKFYLNDIYLGYPSDLSPIHFEHGIGTHPTSSISDSTQWTYQMFNVDGFDYFYAAVGLTGAASLGTGHTNYVKHHVMFEVYGSTEALDASKSNDESLVLLAQSTEITSRNAGEFLVDISGYKTLKLVTRATDAYGSCAAAWGDVSVFNLPETNVYFENSLSLLKGWNPDDLTGEAKGFVATYLGKTVTDTAKVDPDYGYITGSVSGIAGKEMIEEVTMYLTDAEGNRISSVATGTIRDYALDYLKNGTDETGKYKAVAYNMLQYGAAAQTYFGYKTDDLANAGTDGYSSLAIANLDKTGVDDRTRTGDTSYIYGTNLRLKEQVNLMFYLKDLEEGSYVKFTVGGEEKGRVDYADFMSSNVDGVVSVEYTGLAAADYKTAVKCTVYDAEDNELASVTDSVARYAFNAMEKNSASADVCEALLAYSQAVAEYEAAKLAN